MSQNPRQPTTATPTLHQLQKNGRNIVLGITSVAAAANPDYGVQVGLGTADLEKSTINLMSLAIGLVPLVALVMIIIGGFMWMTSAGNEERMMRAKFAISASIIGIVIVLLAWAIVAFFAGGISSATQ